MRNTKLQDQDVLLITLNHAILLCSQNCISAKEDIQGLGEGKRGLLPFPPPFEKHYSNK